MNLSVGNCSREDIALSVLTTVVSRWAEDGGTVDGGTKTFSSDRYSPSRAGGVPQVVELKGMAKAVDRELWIERMTEEHGMFRLGEGASARVGERLRISPYHVCTCVNLSDELVGIRHGIVDRVWRIDARGMRT